MTTPDLIPMSAAERVRIPLQISGLPPDVQLRLEETLLPSPNSVDLLDTPQATYLGRLLAREPNVAELFQANSRLSARGTANQLPTRELCDAVTEWFLATSYNPAEGDVDLDQAREHGVRIEVSDLVAPLAAYLDELSSHNPAEPTLYAVDTWCVIGPTVYRMPARRSTLWKERDLSDDELSRFHQSIFGDSTSPPELTIVWVVAPWRHMVFRGPRGYRHTLIDAGRQFETAERLAARHRLHASTTYDFFDDPLNVLLGLDGDEQAVLAVTLIEPERETP